MIMEATSKILKKHDCVSVGGVLQSISHTFTMNNRKTFFAKIILCNLCMNDECVQNYSASLHVIVINATRHPVWKEKLAPGVKYKISRLKLRIFSQGPHPCQVFYTTRQSSLERLTVSNALMHGFPAVLTYKGRITAIISDMLAIYELDGAKAKLFAAALVGSVDELPTCVNCDESCGESSSITNACQSALRVGSKIIVESPHVFRRTASQVVLLCCSQTVLTTLGAGDESSIADRDHSTAGESSTAAVAHCPAPSVLAVVRGLGLTNIDGLLWLQTLHVDLFNTLDSLEFHHSYRKRCNVFSELLLCLHHKNMQDSSGLSDHQKFQAPFELVTVDALMDVPRHVNEDKQRECYWRYTLSPKSLKCNRVVLCCIQEHCLDVCLATFTQALTSSCTSSSLNLPLLICDAQAAQTCLLPGNVVALFNPTVVNEEFCVFSRDRKVDLYYKRYVMIKPCDIFVLSNERFVNNCCRNRSKACALSTFHESSQNCSGDKTVEILRPVSYFDKPQRTYLTGSSMVVLQLLNKTGLVTEMCRTKTGHILEADDFMFIMKCFVKKVCNENSRACPHIECNGSASPFFMKVKGSKLISELYLSVNGVCSCKVQLPSSDLQQLFKKRSHHWLKTIIAGNETLECVELPQSAVVTEVQQECSSPTFSVKDALANNHSRNSLMNVVARIRGRYHMTPQFESQIASVQQGELGIPGSKIIRLLLEDQVPCNKSNSLVLIAQISAYLSLKSNNLIARYPPGLLPGVKVRLNGVRKVNSKDGRPYLTGSPLTFVEILSPPDELHTEYLPEGSPEQVEEIRNNLPLVRLTDFCTLAETVNYSTTSRFMRVLATLTDVLTVNIRLRCPACSSDVAEHGRCDYVGCHTDLPPELKFFAKFSVEYMGVGALIICTTEDCVRQLLAMSSCDWTRLISAIKQHSLSFSYSLYGSQPHAGHTLRDKVEYVLRCVVRSYSVSCARMQELLLRASRKRKKENGKDYFYCAHLKDVDFVEAARHLLTEAV